jgi:hypothetical protein
MILFQRSLGRSHKTGLTIHTIYEFIIKYATNKTEILLKVALLTITTRPEKKNRYNKKISGMEI